MAFRCSSTNRFASYDDPDPEVESESVGGSTYEVTVRVVRPCAECSEEAAENTFEMSEEVECPNCGNQCGTCNRWHTSWCS